MTTVLVQISFYRVGTIWFKEESVSVPEITMVILFVEQMKTISLIAGSMSLNLKTARKRNWLPMLLLRECMLSVILMVPHMYFLILSPISVKSLLPFVMQIRQC